MKIGGKYNWIGQAERLVYLGVKSYPGNGFWHQFALVTEPDTVWCEVRERDLSSFEKTPDEAPPAGELVCKGDWSLGSACGTCSRCIKSRPAQAEPSVECDCQTAISPDGSRITRCGSDQMRRAVSQGHAFQTAQADPDPKPETLSWTADRWLREIKTAADFSPCMHRGEWDEGLHSMINTALRKLGAPTGDQAQQLMQDQIDYGFSITKGGLRIDPADALKPALVPFKFKKPDDSEGGLP